MILFLIVNAWYLAALSTSASTKKFDTAQHVVDVITQMNLAASADECDDEHESCDVWAKSGECIKNPAYMIHSCSKSCKTCIIKTNTSLICNREFLKLNNTPAYLPMDLNKVLSGIKKTHKSNYA